MNDPTRDYTTRFSSWRMLLGMLFVTLLILSGTLASKIISIGGVSVTGSALAFPLALFLIIALTEVYGYAAAQTMIYVAAVCGLLSVLMRQVVNVLPTGIAWGGTPQVDTLAPYLSRFVFVTLIGFVVGHGIAFNLARHVHRLRGRQGLYTRIVAVPLASQFLSSLIIVPGYYADILPPQKLLSVLLGRLAFAFAFTALTAIPLYRLVGFVRAREKRESAEFAEQTAAYVSRAQELRFTGLADSLSDGLITINQHSTIHFVNLAMTEITRYTRAELLGQSVTMLMPAELRAPHLRGIEHYLHTKERVFDWNDIVLPIVRKDGTQIACRLHLVEFYQDGQVLWTGVMQPVQRDPITEELMRAIAHPT